MIYEAEQDGEMRKIFASADSKFIDMEEIMSLNMIDSRQAKKALKRKGTEFAVYYFRNAPAKEDGADAFAPVVEGVTSPEQRQLNKLLEEYKHVLRSRLPEELPPQRNIDHEIETGDATPVNIRAYPLSFQRLKEQTKRITELLETGLIRESSSSWGSPVLFVKKQNGDWRMCIDYRGLNI
jgi:hypothetical protein